MARLKHAVVSLAVLAVGVLGSLAAATQHVAAAYQYHSGLGPAWFAFGSTSVYLPWRIVPWYLRLAHQAPHVFSGARTAALWVAIPTGLVLLALALRQARATASRPSSAHGSARWATTAELAEANLLRDAGVVLCQSGEARIQRTGSGQLAVKSFGDLVRHDGPEHVMCFAPTRSGKGVGMVIPTLLSWPASCIAWDVKRELWQLTAGWRSAFSHCWRFEPTASDSIRYNPLLEIRRGENEVRDAQAVADMLVDPDGTKEQKDHWQLTAHTLLTGAILHVLYAEADKSLAGVSRFLSDPGRSQFDTLDRMLNTKHLGAAPHPVVEGSAREMLNKAENELSGVFSTALAALGLYRDPLVARATSSSDFRINDLMRADRPASLYLVVAPSDLDRLRPLMRLVINQIGRRLTESNASGGGESYKHRLLMMLDEFPTLGRLQFFESALAYLAGYGIKCFLISQDLNQLEARYGDKNSILSNCHVRITYGANDDHTAERISKLLGQATHASEHVSRSGERFAWIKKQESTSVQEHARPLLTPGEVLQLPPEEALLFVGGLFPYRAKKVLYYQDSRFKARAGLPYQPQQTLRTPAPPTDWDPRSLPAMRSSAERSRRAAMPQA